MHGEPQSNEKAGACLYICSTPIGNLRDVSLRLLDTLRSVDVIAAEDTRHTRKLLTHYEIHPKRLMSYHQHNRRARTEDLVRAWEAGQSIALVTDAGTPGISDPGDDAVALAIANDIPVVPIPGPSAVLSALVASGLPSLPFTFVGFLPRDRKALSSELQKLSSAPGSIVVYESPHRLQKTLEQIALVFPGRQAALAKELTKRYESFVRGRVEELLQYIVAHEPRGEYVIVLGPSEGGLAEQGAADTPELAGAMGTAEDLLNAAVRQARLAMEQGASHREAVKIAVAATGARRSEVYRLTLD